MKLFKKKNKSNPDGKIKWSLYGRVWREVGKPQWRLLLAGIICTIIAASAEGFSVALVKKVIDHGFIDKNMDLLYMLGMQLVAAFAVKGALNYAKSLIMSKAGLRSSAVLQARIYGRVVDTNIDDIQNNGIGKYWNYFGVQANAVLGLVTAQVIKLVQNIASLTIMIGLMIWFAPQLVAIMLVLVPGFLIPMMIILHQTNKLTRKSFEISNTFNQHISQSLSGIKTIQSFGTQDIETEKYKQILGKSLQNNYKTVRIGELRSPIMELVISIGIGVCLILGGHFITSGTLTTGDFTAFILAFTAAYKPAKSITGTNDSIQKGLISAEILFDFMDSIPTIHNAKNAVPLSGDKMNVTFKNVSFAYNETDGNVLNDINIDAESGKIYALVGPSGGGKTTIFNLLERFYDAKDGIISINDKDIKKYTLNSLRKNIAEVSQDVFLFNGTIEENIKYGNEKATQDEIVAAAKIANADGFIMKLPHKYKSTVGERGTMLSGGQKQRIAIARAVLKDAPILLLDEATSALDTESEKLIQSALKNLMRGRTTFVIAHRLSTILDADKIFVIKAGQIIESGTDAELSKLNGEYKKLRDIQFQNI